MNIEQAKAMSIAEILARLDIHPSRTTHHKLLYLSPVRHENSPSFWVDIKTNRWHDFGTGMGGDVIDLARAYLRFSEHADTTADALHWLGHIAPMPPSSHVSATPILPLNPVSVSEPTPTLVLKAKKPIAHLALIRYLDERGIPLKLAQAHLTQLHVHNQATGKSFFALGFANEEDGFELRNPFFKGCLGHKAISFIRGNVPKPESIHLFEGFMDYLSALCQLQARGLPTHFAGDAIILNSLSCYQQIIPYIRGYGYRFAYNWLDNDPAGEKATAAFAEFCSTQGGLTHRPMNHLYAGHKDVNAWHMATRQIGAQPPPQFLAQPTPCNQNAPDHRQDHDQSDVPAHLMGTSVTSRLVL